MARQTTRQMTQKMTPRRILRLLDAGSPDGGPFRKVDPAAASFNATALSAVSQRRRGSKSGQSAKNTAATATQPLSHRRRVKSCHTLIAVSAP